MSAPEHTPLPWIAASAYSSVSGVPIVNSEGRRVGNTALPVRYASMPKEWDELKRRAVADADLICRAVNAHAGLVKALTEIAGRQYTGSSEVLAMAAIARKALAAAGVKP